MKKIIFMILILTFAINTGFSNGVKGKPSKFTIDSTGWRGLLQIDSLASGGVTNFGWGTSHVPNDATNKFIIYDTTYGFDSNGVSQRVVRKIYGDTIMRRSYPNQAEDSVFIEDSAITLVIPISSPFYVLDSNHAVAYIKKGLYIIGTDTSSACTLSVINNSLQNYAKPIFNWSYPGWQRAVSSFTLRVSGMAHYPSEGKPLACMIFSAADDLSDTIRDTVWRAEIDTANMSDTVRVIEYFATFSTTPFTQASTITCNFKAIPWIGDTSTIKRTNDGRYANPSVYYCPLKIFCDKAETYGVTCAVVNNTSGSDVTGIAANISDSATARATPCKTIGGALTKIRAYNNTNHARNNTCGAFVYGDTGITYWLNSSPDVGGGTDCWTTLTHYPGLTRDQFVIYGYATAKDPNVGLMKILDILIHDTTTSHYMFYSADDIYWFDSCFIWDKPSATTSWFQGTPTSYFTNCRIDSSYTGVSWLSAGSNTNLVRGCVFNACNVIGKPHTTIGNYFSHISTADAYVLNEVASASTSKHDSGTIVAFNKFYNLYQSAMQLGTEYGYPQGFVVMQNLFEYAKVNGAGPLLTLGMEMPINGSIVCYNSFVGDRLNYEYNSTGTAPVFVRNGMTKNNICDDYNCKADLVATFSGLRVGNWSVLYGADHSGNMWAEITGTQAPGNFINNFSGISCLQYDAAQDSDFVKYTSNKSKIGKGQAGLGFGTYTLAETSPARRLAVDWLLPYDIDGNRRGPGVTGDSLMAPGAYRYGSEDWPDMSVKCTITVAAGTGGTVNPSGAQIDTCGDSLKIVALPSAGKKFSHWDTTLAQKVNIRNPLNDTTWVSKTDSTNATVTAQFESEVTNNKKRRYFWMTNFILH